MDVYLDNAATAHKRPEASIDAAVDFIRSVSANPGRGCHPLAREAGRLLADTRAKVAAVFGCGDPSLVVFIRNATEAINLFLRGLLREGDRVLATSNEHNAVMRTLTALSVERGIVFDQVRADGRGLIDPTDFAEALSRNRFAAAVVNHVSNVLGTIAPIEDIIRACVERGVPVLIDSAQSAGALPLRMPAGADVAVAFTSHKGLMGIQGTGGLVLGNQGLANRLRALVTGGTGTPMSDERQPESMPERLESGTQPMPAIVSLGASIDFITRVGLDKIECHKRRLTQLLVTGLSGIAGVSMYGPGDSRQIAVVSFRIAGLTSARAAMRLAKLGICCRAGLHCAPSAHRAIGTFPDGTVRFSVGYFNTDDELERAVQAVRELSNGPNRISRPAQPHRNATHSSGKRDAGSHSVP